LIQASFLLFGLWIVLKRLESGLSAVPFHWDRSIFRETLGYSLTFQGIGLTKLLFEPATKVMLARFAGSATLGYFEFAHRMVFQLRSLIVTAYQAVVPTIADLHERQPELIHNIYTESLRFLTFVVGPLLGFFVLVTPLVSELWIGSLEPEFVLFANLVFVAWFLNILTTPAYFSNAGTGHLRWNFLGHLITGVLNIVLGLALGYYFGGVGVVVGFCIGLIVGSFATAAAYHHTNDVSIGQCVDPPTVKLLLVGGASLVVGMLALSWFGALSIYIVPILYLVIMLRPMWLHPQRVNLFTAVHSIILPRRDAASSDDR
jgi:O-antigen/teichoic acid export membrane protein